MTNGWFYFNHRLGRAINASTRTRTINKSSIVHLHFIHKISQVRCGWVIHKQSTINMYDSDVVLYDSPAPALYGPGLTRACCGQVNSRAPTQPGMLSLPATFRDVAEIEMMRKWNEMCLWTWTGGVEWPCTKQSHNLKVNANTYFCVSLQKLRAKIGGT